MKRIREACLLQTIHFQLKENYDHGTAVRAVREELARFKRDLERNGTTYLITEEAEQADGSVIVQVKRQYLNYACEKYMV